MKLMNRRIIDRFIARHADAEPALRRWSRSTESENWLNPHHVRDLHSNARPIGGNRLIFNIKGNDYRLVVEVSYEDQAVWVRFIGTHAQYNRINARRI